MRLHRFCDLSVLVGGARYSAHKAVLAHGSSYFHAELTQNPGVDHLTLDCVEEPVFRSLLHFLYTAECVVMETELPALAEAARFLEMMDMVKLLGGAGGGERGEEEKEKEEKREKEEGEKEEWQRKGDQQ